MKLHPHPQVEREAPGPPGPALAEHGVDGPARPEPVASSRTDSPAIADAVRIAAMLSIAAGLIHAIAMIDHFGHWWAYGLFFLVLTYGQVLWGAVLLRRPPSDRTLARGAYANLALVAVWLWSRTIGIPLGPDGGVEAVGPTDVAAVLVQLVLVAYVAAILRPGLRAGPGFRTLLGHHRMRLAIMLCSSCVFTALLGAGHHTH